MKAVHMTRLFTSYATVTMAQYAMTLSRPAYDLRDAHIDSIAPTPSAFVGSVVFEKKIDKKCFARQKGQPDVVFRPFGQPSDDDEQGRNDERTNRGKYRRPQ